MAWRKNDPNLTNDPRYLESEISELNAQLAERPSYSETRLKAVKLELEDMSESTLSAMTGGATVNVLSIPQSQSVDRTKLSPELEKTIRKYLVPDLEWELGGITSTGGNSTTTIRARTKYVILDAGTKISIEDSNYQIGYAKYDMNKVQTLNTNYLSGGATVDETTYYRIFIKKKDDSDLTNLLSYIDTIVEVVGSQSLLLKADKSDVSSATLNTLDANVKAIAHRGDTIDAPENTIPAYQKAKEKGFSYVESDVRFSSDGYPVMAHLDEVEGNPGVYVSTSTLAELQSLDVGSWKSAEYTGTKIPTFKEFITFCKKNNLHPYIHVKAGDTTQLQGLSTTVKRLGMSERVTWLCQSGSYATAVTAVESKARIGYMTPDISQTRIDAANTLKTGQNEVFLDVEYSVVDQTGSDLCLDNGFGLECYIVNDETAVINLSEIGVTGITTDTMNVAEVLGS
jgi:glycerophosphoryl diester phosphodiesterase